MRFDRPLQVGAVGGHGPIRYSVVAYEPGRRVEFKFTGPRGFNGGHSFEVQEREQGSKLTHTLEMNATGITAITWPLIFQHLHDALVEDGLSRAQRYLNEEPLPVSWSP
jgi:carbon monoxide dehydrogenase subunit G